MKVTFRKTVVMDEIENNRLQYYMTESVEDRVSKSIRDLFNLGWQAWLSGCAEDVRKRYRLFYKIEEKTLSI